MLEIMNCIQIMMRINCLGRIPAKSLELSPTEVNGPRLDAPYSQLGALSIHMETVAGVGVPFGDGNCHSTQARHPELIICDHVPSGFDASDPLAAVLKFW